MFLVVCIISVLISVFLLVPLQVGCGRFFLRAAKGTYEVGDMGYAFSPSYMNIVKIMFFRGLYVFLWSLLFIIPGIIKAYEYRMIPFILAENPNISKEEAFEKTKVMMTGDKLNAFVLDLSFFGWMLLTICTCGLLGLFYVYPYYYNTVAELYYALLPKADGSQGQNGWGVGAYGTPYGQNYDQNYGQGNGQNYGQPYGQNYGQGNDQPYGQPYGQNTDPYQQPYNQNSGQQTYGQTYQQTGQVMPQDPYSPSPAPVYPGNVTDPENPADPSPAPGYPGNQTNPAGQPGISPMNADPASPFTVPYGSDSSKPGSGDPSDNGF